MYLILLNEEYCICISLSSAMVHNDSEAVKKVIIRIVYSYICKLGYVI